MEIIVAGAGIGGLTLALMLHRRGIGCRVYESTQALRPLGVGINLLPHAVNELEQLGLLDQLARQAIPTSALHYYNKFGQPIWREPRGLQAGYPLPQFSIHRGELQMLLADTVRARLGPDAIVTGMALEAADQSEKQACAYFRSRADGTLHTATGDAVVGADGIHSALRQQFYPLGDEPRFSGRMLWRAVTEAPSYLDGCTMFMAGHQDQKFVCYPISAPLRQAGKSLLNWIAELAVPDATLPATDWNRRVDKSVFAERFASWRWDWIDIPAVIDGAQAIYEFPLVDRDPLPRWTRGRLTLLGDAAHPMYPIGSNGSAQAILDARCLADWLSQACQGQVRALETALLEYEAERLPRTAGIVLRNRLNGPEQVMQMAEERAPQGFADIAEVIPEHELQAVSLRYKQLAGFDPAALRRPPPRKAMTTSAPPAPPRLEHVATLHVQVGPPQEVGETPHGRRRVIPILGGRVEGAQLDGIILPGGADFQSIRSATFTDIHARYVIETSDGHRVYVENTGIRTGTANDIACLARGEPVDPARIYFRSYPRFETAAPCLAWLNEQLFIGTGARFPDRVELCFYRIC